METSTPSSEKNAGITLGTNSIDVLSNVVKLSGELTRQISEKNYRNEQLKSINIFKWALLIWLISTQLIVILSAFTYVDKKLVISFNEKILQTYLYGTTIEIIGLLAIAFKWLYKNVPGER